MKECIYKVSFAEEKSKKYFSALSTTRKMLSAFAETLGWLDVMRDEFRIYLYARSEFIGDSFTIRFRYSLSAKDAEGYNGVVSYLHSVADALRNYDSELRSKVTITPPVEKFPDSFQLVDVEFKCWYDIPF